MMTRFVRADSFRLAAHYVAIFIGSAVLLSGTVFYLARNALEQQTVARIELEMDFMRDQFRESREILLRSVDVRGRRQRARLSPSRPDGCPSRRRNAGPARLEARLGDVVCS